MRIQVAAFYAFLATVGCSVTSPGSNDARIVKLASLQRIDSTSGVARFRLSNLTTYSLEYVHWLGGGVEPVPYCKFADGSISVCGEQGRPGEELFTHEIALKAGSSVEFEVENFNAVAVGVLLLLDGKGQYIWSDSVAQQNNRADAVKPMRFSLASYRRAAHCCRSMWKEELRAGISRPSGR